MNNLTPSATNKILLRNLTWTTDLCSLIVDRMQGYKVTHITYTTGWQHCSRILHSTAQGRNRYTLMVTTKHGKSFTATASMAE